jgi:hypothetical protein
MIRIAARTVQLAADYPLFFKDRPQLDDICSVLLHELDVKPRGSIP